MYKVFIKNRALIFCNKNPHKFESNVLFAKNIESLEKDIFPLFEKYSSKIPIVILSHDCKTDFDRLFFDHKYIFAAGGIVQKGDNYLFIKRNGKWDIPKGKLKKKEDVELGAIREIEEECGVTNLSINSFICDTYHTYLNAYKNNEPTLKKTTWFHLNYSGNEDLTPQKSEGITKAKWFKKHKLDKIRSNTYESILEVIDAFFGLENDMLPPQKTD